MEDFTGQQAGQVKNDELITSSSVISSPIIQSLESPGKAIFCIAINIRGFIDLKMKNKSRIRFFCVAILLSSCCCDVVSSKCRKGCHLALTSYFVSPASNISLLSPFITTAPSRIVAFNSSKVFHKETRPRYYRINVPFTCERIRGEFLGRIFLYSLQLGDSYNLIAETYNSSLTTYQWLLLLNSYPGDKISRTIPVKSATANCSCGDGSTSKDYGYCMTYPLMETDTPESIANESGISKEFFFQYNPNAHIRAGTGLVYIPGKDLTGNFVALNLSAGLELKDFVGIAVGSSIGVVFIIGCVAYYGFFRKKQTSLTSGSAKDDYVNGEAERFSVVTIDKTVEFSYRELAKATDNFSLSQKIGQGGFATVYYAELRGQKTAIKKMDVRSSKQFLAELKVLTRVHHTNLVRLIGYCTESSLFLVYEFLENGNLNELLHSSEREPLSWGTRVQIALDSARGFEYIHEHTIPVYIHRDIKSANILIDKNLRGKIADFGLVKLAEETGCRPSGHLAGTFGYMPPEYARDGVVSPKVDVFAFGVVLYELLSGKNAVIDTNESTLATGLASMFEGILNQLDSKEDLWKVMDPELGKKYPLEAAFQMAQLAKACTQQDHQLRPNMRSVVVALMGLTSDEDPDVLPLQKVKKKSVSWSHRVTV